jgi:hypothetical protein
MGTPHGYSYETVNDLNYCHHQGALKALIRALSSQVPETLSAFHLTERQTSSRRRSAHQQRRSFARWDPRLRRSSTSNRLSRLQPAAFLKVDDLENRDAEHEKKATDISQWMIQLWHV